MNRLYTSPQARDFVTLRLMCSLSQQNVSEMLHVTLKTVKNWEKGRSSVPYSAFKLLKVLGRYELPNDEWQGWTINKDKLYSPAGRSFMPHELLYIRNYFSMARYWIADREEMRRYQIEAAKQVPPKLRVIR